MNFVDFCDAVSVIKGYVLYDPLQNLREQAYNPDSVTKLIRDGERIFCCRFECFRTLYIESQSCVSLPT